MKLSIRRQFSLIFLGVMAGAFLLCWLLDHLFLGQYYISSRTKIIFQAYDTIREVADSDTFSAEIFSRELDKICRMYNITVCVMDVNSQTKYLSYNGGRELETQLLGYILGFYSGTVEILEQGDDYVVQRLRTGENEYLEMYGRFSSGISFIMRTPIESIQASARIANRFYTYVGIFSTLAGGVIIWLVTWQLTKPIQELSKISEQMVHLNFEAKYDGKMGNEIDLLGENINKLSSSLEKSIGELKTANNELQKDIESKVKIDEMRKEFLANVSHELKTPIALIQGYAEGLKEAVNDDPESRSFYCEVIMDEAVRMNTMVKKLMALNQMESGYDTVSIERFDVTALIRNYLQSAGILIRQSGIRVCMEEYGPVYVWADEFKIEEVFMNYFSNAMNHCGGEKRIVVSLEQKEHRVRVGVFNTGNPIPEEAIPHLWEKFYKVDKARTREYGGSGVGLSIVKAAMDSMNQKFGVENYSNGVLFWFELETVEEK